METRKRLRGFSYGRVSTYDQAFHKDGSRRDDASLDAQKNRCKSYIDDLNRSSSSKVDYHIIEHLSDEGFSGKDTNRPGFQKLMMAISNRHIDFVVTPELSRLSRNVLNFLDFVNHCEKYGVDVIIIGLQLDTSTAVGKMVLTMMVSLAQLERETTSERIKANTKSRLLTDGRINGAVETLGLDKDPNRKGHFIPNEEELKVVASIFKVYLAQPSKKKTLEKVNSLGLVWKDGRPISKTNINAIFANAKYRYRGVWPVDKTKNAKQGDHVMSLAKLPHGPLIDLKLLDEVEIKLSKTYLERRKSPNNHTYFLSTILVHEDGSSFSGQPAKQRQYRYYYNKQNDLRIRCDELDKRVMKRIAHYLKDSSTFESMLKASFRQRQESLPILDQEISSIQGQLSSCLLEDNKLKESLLGQDGVVTPNFMVWLQSNIDELAKRKVTLEERLEALKRTREEVLRPISIEQLSSSLEKLLGQFKKLSDVQKRRFAEKIFDKIVIKRSNLIELHLNLEPRALPLSNKSSSRGLSGGTNRT